MVIFINQIRMKIGVMFGSPETTTRRQCAEILCLACVWTSAASARSRTATRSSATRPASRWSRTRWRRPSSRSNSTSCMAKASRRSARLVDIGVKAGVVEKSGTWYSYGDERIGQGRENAKLFLKAEPGRRDGDRGQDPRGATGLISRCQAMSARPFWTSEPAKAKEPGTLAGRPFHGNGQGRGRASGHVCRQLEIAGARFTGAFSDVRASR